MFNSIFSLIFVTLIQYFLFNVVIYLFLNILHLFPYINVTLFRNDELTFVNTVTIIFTSLFFNFKNEMGRMMLMQIN